jgi:glutaredoxin
VELDLPQNQAMGAVVAAVTKQRTVPNIFIEGMHVGGYDYLQEVRVIGYDSDDTTICRR